jgi:hypothetical protein
MNTEELAAHFGFPADVDLHQLEVALHEADWPYHRDAAGRLWSVAPEERK